MAHFWIHQPGKQPSWAIWPLDGFSTVFFVQHPKKKVVRLVSDSRLFREILSSVTGYSVPGSSVAWVLCSDPNKKVYVNGSQLSVGMRVLRDRDQIQVASAGPYFFSDERLAKIVPFPGTSNPAHCPRCQQIIKIKSPAVQCPNPKCQLWHHQDPKAELQCWTYSDTCANCSHATSLEEVYHWTPEDLW